MQTTLTQLGPDFRARRADFPSLTREVGGRPLAYFDGPGGSQLPATVIEAVSDYYRRCNANTHGEFITSRESDEILAQARRRCADLLGATGPHQISFGANMTTLNFALSQAVRRALQAGDEILITQLDHEANRGPWLKLREHGIRVREVSIRNDGTLDYEDFERKLAERTRLVAVGWASNALGTVNDIRRIRAATLKVGAWLVVDAVHYTPHFPVDVVTFGCDFLLCSAYKFYGPHVGILYSRPGLLEQFETDRLRTQDPRAPYRIETGTLNHAALAGVAAAVDYLASLGSGASLRERLVSAMHAINLHEGALARRLFQGLQQISGVQLFGPQFDSPRAPTIAFRVAGRHPAQVAEALAAEGICVWNGDFYAVRLTEILGVADQGGLVRAGVSLYTTEEEVDRLLAAVSKLAGF
jgi:cysteine desulfurase family protein (TIGR01976 family)